MLIMQTTPPGRSRQVCILDLLRLSLTKLNSPAWALPVHGVALSTAQHVHARPLCPDARTRARAQGERDL